MSFANPLPWWALALVVFFGAFVAWLAYSRRTLPPRRRGALVALRFITFMALAVFLMRPVVRDTTNDSRGVIVPILVDTSRSMSIEDAPGGSRRIDRARQIAARLVTMLGQQFHVEVLGFGERVAPVEPAALTAAARRSDVEGALVGVRDKYQGRPIAGIVLVSDGGDTSGGGERAAAASAPIFGIGVGAPASGRDREILGVTAAEAILDDSRVELAVSAVSHGFGKTPFDLRLLENGRLIDARRVTPAGDGTPVREIFQVSPGAGAPTVYKIETPVDPGELVPENNVRSTLVQPPTRPRRVLLIEGAPGFEHGFLKRAWASDRGLEVDSVVRKGKNEQGADTFYIQATQSRGEQLTEGYPANREALFRYDALVFANVEGHQLSKAELDLTRSFVGERGGGLLVLGARSFARQGLGGTPIEDVLPLDFTDRGGDVLPASAVRGVNRVALTAAGEAHPIMQLSAAADETRKRWEAVPPLAAIAPVGGPRPGASVLAITSGPSGSPRALVAVQRFGEGRSMAFTGEASWRWRMLMPSADRSFDTFWKQALRWLALSAGDPMQLTITPGAAPGADIPLRIVVRNAGFQPIPDAAVDVRITAPDGRVESVRAVPDPARPGNDGHFVATIRPESAGVFKVAARAQQGGTTAGTANTSVLVGGVDVEMTDPHLNRAFFDRLAAASGGKVLGEEDLTGLASLLVAAVPDAALAARRDLWHTGWSFAAILMLLGAEWMLRRAWGLR